MSSPYRSQDSEPDETSAKLSDDAHAAQEEIQEKIADTAESVASQARDFAERQKQSGAERVEGAADAVHRAAEEMARQIPLAARYVHAGAKQLERASRVLRENSVDELYRMTNKWAHERPLAFIGGSVAAGFVLARVLRSSGGPPTPTAGRRAP